MAKVGESISLEELGIGEVEVGETITLEPDAPDTPTPSPVETAQRSKEVYGKAIEFSLPVPVMERAYDTLTAVGPLGIEDPSDVGKLPDTEVGPTISGQLIGGTLEIGKAIADLPRAIQNMLTNQMTTVLPQPGGPPVIDIPGVTRPRQEPMQSPLYRASKNLSKAVADGVDKLIETHPEWQADPPASLKETFANPDKFVKTLARAVPLLAAAGLSTAAGSPMTAIAIMFAAEKDAARQEFILNGASEQDADDASNIYGFGAAALEFIQVKQGLKLFKGMRTAILNRTAAKLAARGTGKQISMEMAKTAVLESMEEMGQGTWQEMVAVGLLQQVPEGGALGFVERRAQEALFATALSMATGGAGTVSTAVFQKGLMDRRPEIVKALEEGDMARADTLMKEALREAGGETIVTPEELAAGVGPTTETPFNEFDMSTVEGRADATKFLTERAKAIGKFLGLDIADKLFVQAGEGKEVRGISQKGSEIINIFAPQDATLDDLDKILVHEITHLQHPKEERVGIQGRHENEQRIEQLSEEAYQKWQQRPEVEVTEEATPETAIEVGDEPLQIISNALKEAKAVRPKTIAEQKKTRRERVAAAASTLESNLAKEGTPAEKTIFRSSGNLKGPLANYDQVFEPVRDKINAVDPDAIDNAFRSIGESSSLQYFSKLNTAEAFRKLLDGQSLTNREADLIADHFGMELAENAKERVGQDPLADKLTALWRAGLLTGIKTHGLNLVSNAFHGATETGKDVPAVAVDSMVSLFTGERTIGLTARGIPSGMVDGAKKGWNYIKTGKDERDIGAKLDYQRVNFGKNAFAKGLQAYEELIFHLLGAADQPFYYGAKSRSLYSQAIAQAKNQKLKGNARKDFVQRMVQNPTDDMLENAVHDAEVAVFQNKTGIGDMARLLQQGTINGIPVGQIIVPFSRTPGAVATQIINYTPAGPVGEIWNQARNGEFDQRKFSQAVGRGAFGTGVFAIGAALFNSGRISLDRPDSERERELQQAEGVKPNAILIDGKWRSLNTLGPAGMVLGIGAHFQNEYNTSGSPSKAWWAAVSGGAKSFSEQTFVTGANRAMQALSDPERGFESYFSGLAGSTVPTLVADIARATDTVERRAVGAREKIKARVPGLRETLEPQIDAYGQDVPRYGGNTLEIMADPTRPSVVRYDMVVNEIRRLWDLDIKIAPSKIGDKEGYKILEPEENTVLWRRAGDLLHTSIFSVINAKQGEMVDGVEVEQPYANLPDDIKGKVIERLIDAAHNKARAEAAIHKLSQGITIESLQEDGLVNQTVLRTMLMTGVTQ